MFPGDVLVLIDTGADTTTLPFSLASLLGFSTSDLESSVMNAVGGQTTTWKPRTGPNVDIQIGGHWHSLPALAFADKTPPLLGRDLIFRDFKLWMEYGETDLRPK